MFLRPCSELNKTGRERIRWGASLGLLALT